MKKNLFLTFCCACVPGCGQMYQGYMRRGVSLALWFWGIIMVASTLGLGVLGILLPVVWAYAFFDTFNIRNLTPDQRLAFTDDFIPNTYWLRQHHLENAVRKGRGSKVLGWGLIILGMLILYNNLISYIYRFLYDYLPALADILDNIVPLCLAGAVIFVGVQMLRGRSVSRREEDIEMFKGDHTHE